MNGVVLSDLRKKKELELPKSGAKVWIWDDILAGDALGGMQFDPAGQTTPNVVKVVCSIIADWNFIDKEGKKLEVNEDNLKLLSITDFNVLASQISEVTAGQEIEPQKKKNT